jgi:hypothetical protein
MIDSFDELIDRPFLVPDGSALAFLGACDFTKQDLVLNSQKAFKEVDLLKSLLALGLFVGGGKSTPSPHFVLMNLDKLNQLKARRAVHPGLELSSRFIGVEVEQKLLISFVVNDPLRKLFCLLFTRASVSHQGGHICNFFAIELVTHRQAQAVLDRVETCFSSALRRPRPRRFDRVEAVGRFLFGTCHQRLPFIRLRMHNFKGLLLHQLIIFDHGHINGQKGSL